MATKNRHFTLFMALVFGLLLIYTAALAGLAGWAVFDQGRQPDMVIQWGWPSAVFLGLFWIYSIALYRKVEVARKLFVVLAAAVVVYRMGIMAEHIINLNQTTYLMALLMGAIGLAPAIWALAALYYAISYPSFSEEDSTGDAALDPAPESAT